jgi:hypothetical protein
LPYGQHVRKYSIFTINSQMQMRPEGFPPF